MSKTRLALGVLFTAVIISILIVARSGQTAGSFSNQLTSPTGFTITSPAAGSLVPCGQPITVTWTGGNPSDNVNVVLIDVQAFQVFQGFGVEPNTGSRVVTIGPGSCGRQSLFYVEDSPRTTWTYGPVFNVACSNTFNIADGDVAGLISAINSANASACPTTINLAPNGTYTLTDVADDGSGFYCCGPSGLPFVQSPLTINGNGATIQRSNAPGTAPFGIIRVAHYPGPVPSTTSNLTLDGVTLTGATGPVVGVWQSTALIRNTTITNNPGQGILTFGSNLTVLNSTISYNTGTNGYGGGGILHFASPSTVISFSTIFENQSGGVGDAIATAFSDPGSVTVKNSILASPTRGLGLVCWVNGPGAVVSLGHNIAGDSTCGPGGNAAPNGFTGPGDMNNTNPLLGPLANNGGPTRTHMPLECSPAIDAVPASDSTDTNGVPITVDQRGVSRPQGAASDIGSVEVVPTTNCVTPPPNMVSWWPGDGNARDIQGGNDGTPQNGVTFVPGKVGQAFSFAGGLHDFVEVPYNANLDLTQALTIDAWVNPSGVHQHGGIVETGGLNAQYSLHIESGKVLFRLIVVPGVDHRTIQSDSVIPTNTWTHVAGTWDGVVMKLFINGVQQSQTQNVSPPINSGGGSTQIGYTDVNPYAGLIDEVEIFNRALSSDEIRAIYLADSAGKCKPGADTTRPTVSCPSPSTTSADSSCQARVPDVLGGVTASGGCGGPVTLSQSPAAGTLVGLGTTTITVTATDSSHNSSTCTTSFTVTDNTPPSVSCPMSSTASADSNCQARVPNVLAGVAASDCGGPVTLSQSPAAGTLVSLGTTTITVTATDASNNSSTCTTSFTVTDNTPPIVSCPVSSTASADSNCQARVPNVLAGVAASDCGGPVTLSQSPAAGTLVSLGTTTITVTATDAAHNSSTCTTGFTVTDNAPPLFTSGPTVDKPALWPPDHKMVDVTVNYAASDNCSVAVCTLSVTSNEPVNGTGDGDMAPDWEIVDAHHVRLRAERAGTGSGRIYTITITCTDTLGNSSSRTVTVNVPKSQK